MWAAGPATFTWDNASRLATAADPVSGRTFTYGYDKNDNLTSLTSANPTGSQVYAYDGLDRLTTHTLKNGSGAQLAKITYGWDNDDNLTSKTTEGLAGAGANLYGYDQAGRLTSWQAPGGTTTNYVWDAAGNRVQVGAKHFTYDERNRLTSDDDSTYTYSPRGTLDTQTTGGVTRTLVFDAFDQMVSDGDATYGYDALGRMTSRIKGGVERRFVYSGLANDIASVTDAGGAVQAKYGRDPNGGVLSLTEGGGSALGVMTDLHTDVVATYDAAAIADSTAYDPFGTVLAQTGTRRSLGYQSEWTDPDTGKVNMHARWYVPGTGTFASRDSWDLPPGSSAALNRYAYGATSPLTSIDPSGHNVIKDAGGGGSAPVIVAPRGSTGGGSAGAGVVGPAPGVGTAAAGAVAAAGAAAAAGSAGKGSSKGSAKGSPKAGGSKSTSGGHPSAGTADAASDKAAMRANPAKGSPEFCRTHKHDPSCTHPKPKCQPHSPKKECQTNVGHPSDPVKVKKTKKTSAKTTKSNKKTTKKSTTKKTTKKSTTKKSSTKPVERLPWENPTPDILYADSGSDSGGQHTAASCVGYGYSCNADTVEDGDSDSDVIDDIIDDVMPDLPPDVQAGEGECAPANSFVAGTRVLMADGSSKAIEDVKVGDLVVAADPATGQAHAEPVTTLIMGQGLKHLATVTVDVDGARGNATDTITATDGHPFWVGELRTWVTAGALQPGMWLRTSAGTYVQVTAVAKSTAPERVYNLTVADLHTYHVLAGDQAVLVHNDNGDNDEEYFYRGVPDFHWYFQWARRGIAIPKGGHTNPGRHNGGNTNSVFTSWTTDLEGVARDAANEGDAGRGIVLRIPKSAVPLNRIFGSQDIYGESEILIAGIVRDAEISVGYGPWQPPGC